MESQSDYSVQKADATWGYRVPPNYPYNLYDYWFPAYPAYPYQPYEHPCPSCGRCPTCGKRGRYYPRITWTSDKTNAGVSPLTVGEGVAPLIIGVSAVSSGPPGVLLQ